MSSISDLEGPYCYRPGGPAYKDWVNLRYQRQIALKTSQTSAGSIATSIKDAENRLSQDLGRVSDAIQDQTGALSRSLDDICLAIGEFHQDFNWHMDAVRVRLEDMQSILSKLRDELSRRHRTEAFEFYFQSREYADHGMFEKALDSVEVAINGDERARGYELEWRFWEHLGRLRLGSLRNRKIIGLAKAEEAFIQAARLAARNAPKAAAACLVGASFAAYADGRLPIAIEHIRAALSHDNDLAEAHWNLGRYLWQAGHFREASEGFYSALSLDPTYAKRFDADNSLQDPTEEYRRLCAGLVERFRKRFDRRDADGLLQEAKLVSTGSAYLHVDASTSRRVESELEALIRSGQSNDVFTAAQLGNDGNNAVARLRENVDQNRSFLTTRLTAETTKLNDKLESARASCMTAIIPVAYLISVIFMFPILRGIEPDAEIPGLLAGSVLWPFVALMGLVGAPWFAELGKWFLIVSLLSLVSACGILYLWFMSSTRQIQEQIRRITLVKNSLAASSSTWEEGASVARGQPSRAGIFLAGTVVFSALVGLIHYSNRTTGAQAQRDVMQQNTAVNQPSVASSQAIGTSHSLRLAPGETAAWTLLSPGVCIWTDDSDGAEIWLADANGKVWQHRSGRATFRYFTYRAPGHREARPRYHFSAC